MPLMTVDQDQIGEHLSHTFVQSLLRRDPIVLDLGGNVGDFAREMIERYNATVHLYEPVPELFQAVVAGARLKKFEEAVMATAGPVTLHKPVDRCASCLAEVQDGVTLVVQAVTLDTALGRIAEAEIDLVKMDIEGAEIDLLEHAGADSLRKVRQLSIEFHDFLYSGLTARVAAIKTRLAQAGFYMIPFSTRTSGDVLFVRRDLLPFHRYIQYRYATRWRRSAGRTLVRLRDRRRLVAA
jgi:FkbM family methyltransferase